MTAMSAVSKPELDAEDGERHLRARQSERLRPCGDRAEIVQAVLGQHVAHALTRAVAPQPDGDALAAGLQRLDVRGDRLEHVLARLAAFGGEVLAGMRRDIDHVGGALGGCEWRELRER